MELSWLLIVSCIALLLIFDFTNGFHDTANMVASVIASRAMTPGQVILLVSVFTFIGPVLGGTAVANTLGGFVSLETLPRETAISVLLSGTLGAIFLNLLTWWRGLPSSSSHALIGGLSGAVLIAAGSEHIVWGGQELFTHGQWTGLTKILATLIFSPILGLVVGWSLHKIMRICLRRSHPGISQSLRRFQWLSVAWLAFSHA